MFYNYSIRTWYSVFILIILFSGLFIQNNYAQVSWDGGAGTSLWSDANNWLPDGVPTAGDDVTIGSGYSIVVDADNSCASLTLSDNSANTLITINAGITLTVAGDITYGSPSNNINQTIDVGDGNLSCTNLTMPNTGSNTRDDYLYINDGTLTVPGTLRMYGGGGRNRVQVFGTGTITIGGDFRGGRFDRGNSTVIYNGTGSQLIGNYSYFNLTVSNSGTKSLLNTTLVYSTLLLDGIIDLDNRQLRITTSGSISVPGGFSNTKMLDFQNGGTFRRDGNSAALYQMIYPVGSGSDYSPFEITSLSGTIGGGNLQIKCIDSKHPLTSGTNNAITKYWDISTTNITVSNIQGTFTYSDNDVAPPITETNLTMVGRLTGSGWQTNETGTGYDHGNNQIVLNGAVPSLDGNWTLGESSGCFDGTLPDKYTIANGNWNTGSIWNDGAVPGASDDVAVLHTVTLNTGSTINSLMVAETGQLNLSNQNITVTTTTIIDGTLIDNNNGGTNTFTGSFTVSSAGSFTTNNRSPFIFEGGITNEGTFAITNGAANISFNTNSQSISGSATLRLNGSISIGSGVTLTNQNTDATTGLQISGNINGTDGTSVLDNRGLITYENAAIPMSTGVLDASSGINTFRYARTANQNIKGITYSTLEFTNSGNRTLSGNVTVNNDFITSGTVNTVCGANDLTLNGIVTFGSSGNFTTGANIVTYGSTGDQYIVTGTYNGQLITSGSGIKTLQGNIPVSGNITVGGTTTLNLAGNILTSSGDITIQNNSTLEIEAGSQLLIANTRTLTNNGVLSVVGTAGNEAIISRNGGTGGYAIVQADASAEFNAQYYQIEYLSGGITISAGQINSTNNFSNGTFTNGSGTEYMNITGIDVSVLPNIANVVFDAGPTYNVTRTSGTGTATFTDASGALSGENFDNDNGNPGTLINWSYPASTYYSTGNVSAGLTTSWTRNPDGTGGNPASVTDGLNTLIIQDGHTVILDNNGDIDVLALQVGEGTSGIFRIGSDATQRRAIIRELLDIQTGGSINVGSAGSPTHLLQIYGNINNDGSINLRSSGSDIVNTEFYGTGSNIQGSSTPVFNDITFKSASVTTTAIGIDINGNVFIETAAEFNDGGQIHTVAGNWSVTGTGTYTASGTINFDGLINSIQDNPSGTLVNFNNLTFSGGGAGSIQENTLVTGNINITNSTTVSVPNVRITSEGDFTVDAGSSYNQTANTTNFNSSNAQSINLTGTNSFANVEFTNGGANAKTVNGNMSAQNRVTVFNGATVTGNGDHTIAGGLRIDGTCNFSGSVTLTGNSLFTYDAGNALTLGTAELIIDGNVNLTYGGSATSLTATVSNNVTVTTGYLLLNNNTQLIGQPGNTLRLEPARSLYCRGVDNFPTGFGTYDLESTSYVIYDASFDQTVRGNITYGRLRLGGGSATLKTVDGPLDIDDYLDLNNAVILDLQSFSHTLAGNIYNRTNSSISGANATFTLDAEDVDQTIQYSGTGNYTFNTLNITQTGASASRTKTFESGSNIVLNAGDFTISNLGGSSAILLTVDLRDNGITGTPGNLNLGAYCELRTTSADFGADVTDNFTGSKSLDVNSTVYYSLGGAQLIADGFTYGNLTFNGGNKTARGALDIDGSISRTAGTPVFFDAGFTHTVAGDWMLNSGNYYTQASATGTITFDGIDQDINGINFNNVIVSNSGIANVINNLTIYGDLTVMASASIDFSTRNMNLEGNFAVLGNGLFTQTSGTSTFNGNANQTITSNATSYLGHFLINKPNPAGSQTVSVLSELHIAGNTTLTADAGVLDITGQDVYFGLRLYVEANTVEAGTTFNTTGSNVTFDGTDAQYIRNANTNPLVFNNILFTGGGDKTIDINTGGSRNMEVNGNFTIDGSVVSASGWGRGGMDIYVRGNWDNTGTFLHSNARTVYFDGANQTITSSGFWNLDIGGTNTKTLLGNISAYSNLTISAAELDANNNNITVDGNWSNIVPGVIFTPGTGKVIFNGGNSQVFTGAETGPAAGKGFYDVEINKNAATATLRGHLDVENSLELTSGNLTTDTNSIWLAGDYLGSGGNLNQNNNASILRLDATGGSHSFDPQGENFRGIIVNAPGAVYTTQSDFSITNVNMQIEDGDFVLNGNTLTVNNNNRTIELNGGTLNVDSASVIEFNGNNQQLNINGGTFRLVGSSSQTAALTRNTGTFSVNQTGGTIHANYYTIRNGNITITNGTIDGTNNFSNGTFADGAGNAYLTLTGLNFTDFTVVNTVFNSGPTYNVSRTSGTGVITFQDASGGLAGENYDQDDADPGTLIVWTFPSGFFWDGGAGTEDWHDANNWSGNVVPTINDIAFLNHDFVATAYNIRVMSNDAVAKRVIMDAQGGNTINLYIENGYNHTIGEHLEIGTNTVLTVSNTASEIFVGKNWTNQGTFNHGNSTVTFNGPAGNYTIATGGAGAGKSFYNLVINAADAIYGLNDAADIDNNLTISNGTLNLYSGANDVTVGGDWFLDQMNGGIFICSTADVNFDGSDQSITNGTFYNLITSGSGTKTLNSNIDIDNTLTIGSGTAFDGQAYTIYTGNDWYNNGTFSQTGLGTVIFDGTVYQEIDAGTVITDFNHLSFLNNGGKIFRNASNVTGNMTINGGSGTVNVDTYQITGVGASNTLNNFGTLEIRGINNFPSGFETITLASNSTVTYRADIDQQIYSTQYGNLRLRSLTGANTLKTALGDLDITGSLYMNNDDVTTLDVATNESYITLTGNLSITAGNDIIWGTGNSTIEHVGANWYIDADLDSLNHVILNGTDDKYLQGDLLIGGNVTVKSNIDLRMYQTSGTANYHRMIGSASRTFTAENNARVMNSTPGSVTSAIPEGFGTYILDDNSTYYLISPAGTDQTVYTGNSISYGNLIFNNNKTVTSDGLAELDIDGNFDMNDATYLDNGQNMKIGGDNIYLTYYVPSTSAIIINLDGLGNQYLRDDRENIILLPTIYFTGSGTKTYGDGNDVITIDGDLSVISGVTATSARNITFNGMNWTNNGIYTQSGGTITFNGGADQTIKSGASDPFNYFRNLSFSNSSAKTFVTDGADINGNFTINSGTVDLGTLSHTLSGQLTNNMGGTLISANTDILFDGGNQNVNTPAFEINNVTASGTGTKRLFSNWTVNGDLTINSGTTLNTSDNVIPTYYDISIKGNWINNGNFVDNTAKVTFDGNTSPIQITSGGSNFYDVEFNPTAAVDYSLLSPSSRIARTMTLGANASLSLNSNTLILGSNIAAGKLYTINGTLTVNENASLLFNNRTSQSIMNVSGTLNVIGTSSVNVATISRELAGIAGSETQINILSGGTLAARYYLIEYLQDAGLNMQSGSTLDATNNLSDGTWSNIRNAVNVRYLTLEADYAGGTISNITFNFSGTPTEGTHFNVLRETGPTDITFDMVGGNLGGYKYEDDEEASPSPTSGKLRWPAVTETNWTGAINTNWHLDGNWDNGIPTLTIDAIIPDRANDPIITDMDAVCKNLTITDGTLILDNNRNITATGDVTIGSGTSVGIFSVNTANSIVTTGGNWTRGTNGIFLNGGSTVIFNSGTGTATITPRNSDFHNIVFDNVVTSFYLSGTTINFSGKFEILGGIVIPGTNNYNYYIDGDIDFSGGTFTPTQGGVTAGTINLTGTADQLITNGTFHHLIVAGSGSKNLTGSAIISGNTTIQSTLTANTGCTIDFNGNVTIDASGTFNDGNEQHNFSGINWIDNGSYVGNGTMVFDRTTSNQNLYRGNFNNLIINCTNRRLILRDSVTISGDLTLMNGTNRLDLQENIIRHTSGTGTFTLEDNTRVFVYGADNFPQNFGLYDIATTSTVYYYGSSDQNIAGVSYGNLYLNNANTKTLSGDTEVKRNLIFNASTLDVSNNNYTLRIGGTWNNNNTGNFTCRMGEVIFNGSANQTIVIGGLNINEFFNVKVEKTSGYVSANNNTSNDFIIQNNLIVTGGDFNANNRTIYIGGDMLATGTGGFWNNTGIYYLNKVSGSALVGVNGSTLRDLTINSAGGATFTAQDDITLIGDFNLLAGTFNGNGKYISLGNGNSDIANILGTYLVGPGGSIALGNGTTLTVDAAGSIEIVGNSSSIARVTRNTSGGRYNFIVNGSVAAKYYLFEYMTNAGIYLSSTATIDATNNFSEGTFTRGANSGQLVRIENTQSFLDPNYVENVSFPINPGGSASNVAKITATTGDVEFYNATGLFAGENYDNDPSDKIHWTGPIELTWNGSVSTDWNDSLNWTASSGPPIVPTGAENVIIAPATNQPILTTFGAKTLNLTINNGASIVFNTPADGGQSDLDIGGDITIDGAIQLLSTDDYITVTGNWTRGTTGTAIINGNVKFDGSGGAKVIDNRGISFYNLTISGTSQYQLGRNTTIDNDLVIDAGATFDVSPANYSLTVSGNWTNNGTFYSQTGKVIFNASSGSRTIRGGTSPFNDIDINASGVIYTLDGNLSLKRNLNIINGTLDINGNTLTLGNNSGTDNLTVSGSLIADENSLINMGTNSRFNANSGSLIQILGTDALNRARISSQTGGRYSLDINSGATIHARYYEIEYTDADGLYVHSGANVDLTNNFSDGIFSNGYPGSGTYLKLEHEPGANDTIRNVTFNAGSAYNVSRTVGTSVFFFLDAGGAMGTYEFENDIGAPDPSNGLIHWPYLNTYIWTGAIDTDWHKPGNWSGGIVPDITKNAIIPSTASNFPDISTGVAEAKSITVNTDAKLTVSNTLNIAENLLYADSVFAVGSPTITIGKSWTSNGGIFIPDNSNVVLSASGGTENIETNGGTFFNLEIDAAGVTYNLTTDQTIANDLTISNGTLDLNGNDLNIAGSLLNNGSMNVGTRTITFNGTSGTHSIQTGGASIYNLTINSSTGLATYQLGNNTSILNNVTITNGILDLSPDGGTTNYDLTIGNRLTNSLGTLYSRAGTIEVGENWITGGAATFDAGTGTVRFTAGSGIKSIYPRNNAFYDLEFNGAATFRLSSNMTVANDLVITNGTLDVALTPSYNITISGNWINNATFLSRNGTVTFNGTNQSITHAGSESFYNLTVSNNQLTLNNDCQVTNTFTLQSGDILTGANTLSLGTGTGNTGTLNYSAGTIIGQFERWLNAIETDYQFPIGSASNTNLMVVRFVAGFTAGSLVTEFDASDPGTAGLPVDDGGTPVDNTFSEGFWTISARNSLAATNYNIRLDAQGFVSHSINSLTRIIKRTNGGNWTVDGVHADPGGTICYRNTLNGISTTTTDFCLGVSSCLGGTIGDADTVCVDSDLVPFINYVSPSGGTGYTYTWQETTVLTAIPGDVNWTDLPSSNSLTYDYGIITDTIKVIRKAVATGCPTTYSNEILIEIWQKPTTGPIWHIKDEWAD